MGKAQPTKIGKKRKLFDKAVEDLITGLEGSDHEVNEEYITNPVEFMIKELGIREKTIKWSMNPEYENHKWDGDRDPLVEMCNSVASWEDTGIESATATGKTFISALLVFWFLHCFKNSLVVTIAPKEKQLTLNLWKEIGYLWPRFQAIHPKAQLTKLMIRMNPPRKKWAAVGLPVGVGASERSATKLQGFHEEHMLFITEETPGISDPIIKAIENTATSPKNIHLALGNPDHVQDTLHKFCEHDTTNNIRISALDHPNVVKNDPNFIPGAVSKQKIEKRKERYRTPDHPLYLSRIRGICPSQSENSLIKFQWIKESISIGEMFANELRSEGPRALGVDVANSEVGDEAAIARGKGALLEEVETFPCGNANELGERVNTEMKANGIKDRNVGVDSIGIGAGTVNELKRLGSYVNALNGASKPVFTGGEERFANLRSQMWWRLAMDLQDNKIGLPNDEELIADLTTPRWTTKNGKIAIESKNELKKRLGRSPDKGDAVVYWNWIRHGAGISGDLLIGRAS